MSITIRSRREGFRRCGMAHSVAPTTHPGDAFTAAQLEILRAEPLLIVEEAPGDESEKAARTPAKTARGK